MQGGGGERVRGGRVLWWWGLSVVGLDLMEAVSNYLIFITNGMLFCWLLGLAGSIFGWHSISIQAGMLMLLLPSHTDSQRDQRRVLCPQCPRQSSLCFARARYRVRFPMPILVGSRSTAQALAFHHETTGPVRFHRGD